MRLSHALEYAGVRTLDGLAHLLGRGGSRAAGTAIGGLASVLGVRRKVAGENLARAFPALDAPARRALLARHFRELGRVVMEYPHLASMGRDPGTGVVAAVRGREHLEGATSGGRGAILMSGHFGNFELGAAWFARFAPVDLLVRPLSNPLVDRWICDLRERAGLGLIRADRGVRGVYASIRAGRSVAMLADQDARGHGVFVPFFGTPASTPVGPARLAIALRVPIVMGFLWRRPDGRHELDFEPPLVPAGEGEAEERRITTWHTALLESWVRRKPEAYFWLHRRWKTRPPSPAGTGER